jgi:hypothetical protein
MRKQSKSAIIYQGPSLIDGAPIVAIAVESNRNKKTGKMLQTYILRSDTDPRLASKLGLDKSICGTCPMRGQATNDPQAKQAINRACYVLLGQGPLIVWQAYQKGLYPMAQDIAAIGESALVRIGTYGDGAAVPAYVWQALLSKAKAHTGYSHQSRNKSAAFDPALYMVSVETIQQATQAWKKAFRTFRVVKSLLEIDKTHETLCPASKEGGKRTTCADCKLCGGNTVKAKSIAIVAHGAGAGHFH